MNLETQQCIAENLKYLRNFYGYTQDQVADFLHVARSTYTLLESGRKIQLHSRSRNKITESFPQ